VAACERVCPCVCVSVCASRVWLCGGLTPDTGGCRCGAAAEGLRAPACLQWTERAAAGSGVWAPRRPGPRRPRFRDGAGALGAASRAGEGATVPRRGWWSSPLGLAQRRRVRGRDKACLLSSFNFLLFQSCWFAASPQTEIDSSVPGGPKRWCLVVVVHLWGLVMGFVIFILVQR